MGRIGSINAQTLFLDRKHRVWTTDDYGHLVRYDPEKDRLERSPFVLPHNPEFQTGWHSVFYDVAAAPGRRVRLCGDLDRRLRLMRIWPNEGEWPRVEDLGPATQKRDPTLPKDTFVDHCGGLALPGTASCITSPRAGATRCITRCRRTARSARAWCGG